MFEFLWVNAVLSYMSTFFKEKKKEKQKPGISGCLGRVETPKLSLPKLQKRIFSSTKERSGQAVPGVLAENPPLLLCRHTALVCVGVVLLAAVSGVPFSRMPRETFPSVLRTRKVPRCYVSTPTPVTNKGDVTTETGLGGSGPPSGAGLGSSPVTLLVARKGADGWRRRCRISKGLGGWRGR